jgi:hypothetical protein
MFKRTALGTINANRISRSVVAPGLPETYQNGEDLRSEIDLDDRRASTPAVSMQDPRNSITIGGPKKLQRSTSGKLADMLNAKLASQERRDAISNSSTLKRIENSIHRRVGYISAYKNIIFLILIMFTVYLLIFVYATGWFFTDANGVPIQPHEMSYNDRVMNSIYFSTTQMSTVGFGDICPKNNKAKFVVSVFHVVCFVITIGVMGVLTTDLSRSLEITNLFTK